MKLEPIENNEKLEILKEEENSIYFES